MYKRQLANLLNLQIKELDLKYFNGVKNQKYSINLVDNLSVEQIIMFKENEDNFLGIEILRKVKRYYPYKTLGAQLLVMFQQLQIQNLIFFQNKDIGLMILLVEQELRRLMKII